MTPCARRPDGGTVTELVTLGGPFSAANAVNDRGQIAGSAMQGETTRAIVLTPTGCN